MIKCAADYEYQLALHVRQCFPAPLPIALSWLSDQGHKEAPADILLLSTYNTNLLVDCLLRLANGHNVEEAQIKYLVLKSSGTELQYYYPIPPVQFPE